MASPRLITANAAELLDAWLVDQPGARVRLLGVGVAALAPGGQLALFETEEEQVRERFGAAALVRARDLD